MASPRHVGRFAPPTPTSGMKKHIRTEPRPHSWAVDPTGAVVDFDMKVLRDDLMLRMKAQLPLYTLEECKVLMREMTRTAQQWQEKELAHLLYLSQLHQRAFPGRPLRYQWPPSALPTVPFDFGMESASENATYKLSKIVSELNRSMLRMIDVLFNERRERLLLAARIIQDLEAVPELE
eukprot:PhM_4_TR6953/c0_g1_i1/m.20253